MSENTILKLGSELSHKKKVSFKKNIISKLSKIKRKKNKKKIKTKTKDNINKIEHLNKSTKPIKVRDPGVDLIRIITQYNIIIFHLFSNGRIASKYSMYKKQLRLIEIFIFYHDSIFSMISGVVGYKSTKYSNLLYLWLYTLFHLDSVLLYYKKYKPQIFSQVIKSNLDYFPVISERYWYFTAYFGMYLFLPAINKGIQNLNKSELKLLVMSIIGVFFIWRHYMNPKNDIFRFHGCFSSIWLLTNYLIGAYIGKYRVNYNGIKKYIYCLICLFIYVSLSLFYNKLQYYELYNINGYYKRKIIIILKKIIKDNYDSTLKTIQAICIILFFLQIKYNKYLSKIICFIGPLSFGVYLAHCNPIIIEYEMPRMFNREPYNLDLYSVIKLFTLKGLYIFVLCITFDYLRHIIFTFLRIRKICIFLEKLTFKIF